MKKITTLLIVLLSIGLFSCNNQAGNNPSIDNSIDETQDNSSFSEFDYSSQTSIEEISKEEIDHNKIVEEIIFNTFELKSFSVNKYIPSQAEFIDYYVEEGLIYYLNENIETYISEEEGKAYVTTNNLENKKVTKEEYTEDYSFDLSYVINHNLEIKDQLMPIYLEHFSDDYLFGEGYTFINNNNERIDVVFNEEKTLLKGINLYGEGNNIVIRYKITPDTKEINIPEHIHEYANSWTILENGHYKECICHEGVEVEIIPHIDEDNNGDCDDCFYYVGKIITYTIHTIKTDGSLLKNVKVELFKDDILVDSKISDETGMIDFTIREGTYKAKITHLNNAYIYQGESEIDLEVKIDKPPFIAVFEESFESVEYIFDFSNNGIANYDHLIVNIFTTYGYMEGLLAVNGKGQAITYMVNDDYVIGVFDTLNDEYQSYVILKDEPTFINMEFAPKGKPASQEAPVLLFEFLSKPFNDDVREPFDWDNKFNKGETKYALLHNALGKEFSISASKFEVSYNGFEVTEVDGNRLVTHFEELELGETAIIKITALEEAVEDIIYIDNTSKGDPANISFYDLGSDITYTFYYEGEVKWFTFYCYKAGEVQISVTNGSVSEESIIVDPFEDYYFSITATSAGEVILTTKFIESN